MKLTVIRGLPGSGKSTEAKKLNVFHIEADMFQMKNGKYCFDVNYQKRAHKLCHELVDEMLSTLSDVVVSNTFTQLWEMEPYLKTAKYYGAEVEVIRMETKYESIHNVPDEEYEKMRERFEDYKTEHIVN